MFHAFTPGKFVAGVVGLAALVSAHPLAAGAGVTCAEVPTATAHDESPIHPPTAVWPPFARSPRRVAGVRIDPISQGVGTGQFTFGDAGIRQPQVPAPDGWATAPDRFPTPVRTEDATASGGRPATLMVDQRSDPVFGSWSTFGPGGPNTTSVADEIPQPLRWPPGRPAEASGRERAVFTGARGPGKYTAEAEAYAPGCPGGGRGTGRHTDGSGLALAPSRTDDTRHPMPPPSSVWVGLLTLGGLAVAQACGWRAGRPRRVR